MIGSCFFFFFKLSSQGPEGSSLGAFGPHGELDGSAVGLAVHCQLARLSGENFLGREGEGMGSGGYP